MLALKIYGVALQARIPVILWGAPGVAKTSVTYAIAKQWNSHIECVIASIRDPSEIGGLPVKDAEKGIIYEPPSWAKRLAEVENGILFFDEISTAPPSVQAALLRVIFEKVVGDLEMSPTTMIASASNPPEMSAGGWDLSMPLANRFCHLSWSLNPIVWVEGMLSDFRTQLLPQLSDLKQIDPGWKEWRGTIAAFIKARPELLLQVPKEESLAGKAWPSPRTWDFSAKLMGTAAALGYDKGNPDDLDIYSGCMAGVVGDGPTLEFWKWFRELDLPDPEELLRNPKKFKFPNRGDFVFAVLNAVTSAVVNNLDVERWSKGWEVLETAADQGFLDVAAVSAKSLARATPKGGKIPGSALKKFYEVLKDAGKFEEKKSVRGGRW